MGAGICNVCTDTEKSWGSQRGLKSPIGIELLSINSSEEITFEGKEENEGTSYRMASIIPGK